MVLNRDDLKREQLDELYRTRLVHLKRAQILYRDERVPEAVDSYNKYLGVLALYYNIPEEKLTPSLFDPEKDVTELLLISHAYWDLSKAYDRSPSLHRECLRCLDQFVKFSIGYKYQHVNAQIIKKFIYKKQAHNLKAFEAAYQKIQIHSKKCYVATHCFGENSVEVEVLRDWRDRIAGNLFSNFFIVKYYETSPRLIRFIERRPLLGTGLTRFFFRPLIKMVYGIICLFSKK